MPKNKHKKYNVTYRCSHCGYGEYQELQKEKKECPNCGYLMSVEKRKQNTKYFDKKIFSPIENRILGNKI